jgi:serine/threonine protein kinase
VRSHRIVDRCGHRLPRAEIYGLLKHPHLASLRYVGRTSECWLLYMDLTDSTTALTHFISTYHHSLGLGPTLELVDPDWWESWICEMARQIGSALRYCFLHSISYGALRTDDVLVTDTGNIKLVGFDLIDMENMTHDKEAFTTFTYGTVIWHMACGTPPWPEKDNLERYAHPRSSVLTRPSYMSSRKFISSYITSVRFSNHVFRVL